MKVGELQIQMYADVARLASDMHQAREIVSSGAMAMQRAADAAKAALGGIVAGLTVAAFASFIENAARAGKQLNELSVQTGVTVEALSGLAAVGKSTGTSVQDIAGMMSKLARNMAGAREEGKGTGLALQALGINFAEFRKLAPDEQFLVIAKSMDRFADGGGKAAAVQAILGKGAAGNIPYFKELALVQELQAKRTTEQAEAGKTLENSLLQLRANQQAWRNDVANAMLPALADAAKGFLDVTTNVGGLRDEAKKLAKDGTITEWTRSTVNGLSYVVDATQYVQRTFKQTGDFFGALLAEMENVATTAGSVMILFQKGEVKTAIGELTKGIERQNAIWGTYMKGAGDLWGDDTLGAKLRARIKELEDMHDAARPPEKPGVDFVNTDEKAGGGGLSKEDQQHNAYVDLLARIREKINANKLEAEQERDLTDAQRVRLEIQKLVEKETLSSKDAASEMTSQLMEQLTATEKAAKAAKDFTKSMNDNAVAWNKIIEDSEKSSDRLRDDTRAQRDHNAAIGLGAGAMGALEAARLRDKAAMLEHRAEVFRTIDLSGTTSETLLAEAKRWRELADAKQEGGRLEQQEKVREEWKRTSDSINQSLTDALLRGFESGKGFAQNFRDTLKNMFNSLVLRPVIQGMLAPVSGMLGGVTQTIKGGSTLSSLGSLGGIASLGSSASSLWSIGSQYFGGSMSGTNAAATMYANASGTGIDGLMAATGAYGTASSTAAGGAGMAGGGMAMAGSAGLIGLAAMLDMRMEKSRGLPWWTAAALPGAWLLADMFGYQKPGGPKDEIGFGLGIDRTPSALQGKAITEGIKAQYEAIVRATGGAPGSLDLGYFSAQDPKGNAMTQLQVRAALNGSDIYDRSARTGGTENVERGDEALKAAVTEETQRVILQALKASNLTGAVGDYLKQLGDLNGLTGGDMEKALTHIQQAAALDAKMFDLTATEEEKLARVRDNELASLDDLNKATAKRIYAIQDEMKAQAEAANALDRAAQSAKAASEFMANLRTNIGAYLDKLNGSPAGMLAPQAQLANARGSFDMQLALARTGDRTALQGLTGYADQLISAQTAYTASGPDTAATIAYIKQSLTGLPGVGDPTQYLVDAIKAAGANTDATINASGIGTNNTILNTSRDATGRLWDGLWGQAGFLATKFDSLDTNVNGLLSFDELKAALGAMATDETLRDLMARADTNKDGQISKLEAIKAAVDMNTTVTAAGDQAQIIANASAGSTAGAATSVPSTPSPFGGAAPGWHVTGLPNLADSVIDPAIYYQVLNSALAGDQASQSQLVQWGMASYAVGTAYVPNDGMAYLHQGERVLTRAENDGLLDEVRGLRQEVRTLTTVTGTGLRENANHGAEVAENTGRTKLDSLLAESSH